MKILLKIILLFGFVFVIQSHLRSQPITWQRTYGDNTNDYGYSVVQTPDGGYIAAGRKISNMYVMRLNQFGDIIWTKEFTGYQASSIIKTLDNNYIILGTFSDLIKINLQGETIWNRNFGFRSTNIKESSDGTLIICGWSVNGFLKIPVLLKLKSNGNIIFQKQYLTNFIEANFRDLVINKNGEYVICGNYSDSDNTHIDKLMLLKTDTAGYQLWFAGNDSLFYNSPNSIINSNNDGYIVGGTNGRSFVIKFNIDGILIWKKTFDPLNFGVCRSIINSNYGGYIFTGTWDSTNNSDYYVRLYKLDANGNEEWRKSYGVNDNDDGYTIRQTLDSGYVIIGIRDNFNNGDIYIVKTDKSGYANPQVSISNNSKIISTDYELKQNFPNPFNPTTKINYSISNRKFVKLSVYNFLGKEVGSLVNEMQNSGFYSAIFDGSNLPNGTYFCSLVVNGSIKSSIKMILIK